MAGPTYKVHGRIRVEPLDGLTLIFHEASGQTHFVASPVPEILEALGARPANVDELLARLETRFDLKPSPSMGEGWVGVNADEGRRVSGHATPPQPLPIKGRGLEAELETHLQNLHALGLVTRQ